MREEWRAYRSHAKKNVASLLPQLAKEGARRLEDLRIIFDDDGDHGRLLDLAKQLALYTDGCSDGRWAVSEEIIESDLARTLVSVAKTIVPDEIGPMTTESELEIWAKHMQPVWKGTITEIEKTLIACCEEAEALGMLQGKPSRRDIKQLLL